MLVVIPGALAIFVDTFPRSSAPCFQSHLQVEKIRRESGKRLQYIQGTASLKNILFKGIRKERKRI